METSPYMLLDEEGGNMALRQKIRTALRVSCKRIRDRAMAGGEDAPQDVDIKWARYVLNKPDHEVEKVLGLIIAEYRDRPGDIALIKDHKVQEFVDAQVAFLVMAAAPGPIVGGA